MRPGSEEDLDRDLTWERTQLSWARTGLAFMGLGGALIRLVPVAGIAIVGLGALIWLLGWVERREPQGRRLRWLTQARRLQLIAWGTTLVAVIALVIALFHQGGSGLIR